MGVGTEIFDAIQGWWPLSDFAGVGSVMHDLIDTEFAPWGRLKPGTPTHDGTWVNSSGIGQGICGSLHMPLSCRLDDGAYAQGGWARSGAAGGSIPYAGGVPFYDPTSFTLGIWGRPSFNDPLCPGLTTDFLYLPNFGGAPVVSYVAGDQISFDGKIWIAQSNFTVRDDQPPPLFGDWRENFDWEACYGDKVPYFTFGLMGDHSGFPFNAGWMLYTIFTPDETDDSHFNPVAGNNVRGSYRLVLESESPGGSVARINAGQTIHNQWQWYVITSDGVTIRVYWNGGQAGQMDAADFVTSQSSLGFGYVDRNKALSGKHELWQGCLDEAMWWDRALTHEEIWGIWNDEDPWCIYRPALQISSAHRAHVPNANPSAAKTGHLPHLSGTRFRGEPTGSPSPDAIAAGIPSLSNVRFRARR